MFLYSDSISHPEGLLLRKYCRTRIPLFLRIIPILMITFQRKVNLPFLQLALLNAEDIRICLMEVI